MSWNSTNKPQALGDHLEKMFDPENMPTGYKRGMVLKIFRAKIKECTNQRLAATVTTARLKGQDDNPTLYCTCTPSMAAYELARHCHQIKTLINDRLKSDFVKDIRFS